MSDLIINVSTQDELYAALDKATGGETIVLSPGDYGRIELSTGRTGSVDAVYGSEVKIISADSENPASLSGLHLFGAANLSFENIKFDYTSYEAAPVYSYPFEITHSENIAIRNSIFDGDLAYGFGTEADGKGTGKGLQVAGVDNFVLEGNEFYNWHRAAVFFSSDNLTILDNEVYGIRSDGFDFNEIHSALIEGNHFHDFDAAPGTGDHGDMIQFWTNGNTTPTTDIVIRGNILDVGDGDGTQSIFMRNGMVDQGVAGEEMFYQNILIEENLILNNSSHGITVGETNGLIIRNNTVLDADTSLSSSVNTPKINLAPLSTNVTVEGNVAAAITGYVDQPNWAVSNNVLVQNTDPNALGYYESEFINSSLSGDITGYIVDPNGTIAQLDAGASRLHLDTTPDTIRAAFDASSDGDAQNTVIFDAGFTYGPTGKMSASDAQFIWDFGDGTTAVGQVVSHEYVNADRYEATLTVVMPDGTTAKAVSEIGIMGADVLSYDPLIGLFKAEGYGIATEIEGSDRTSVTLDSSQGVDLGGAGAQLGIGKEHLSRLFGANSFDMSMTLRADTLGSIGEVARVHGNFVLSIAPRGEVNLTLWTDTQAAQVNTTGVTVNDGMDHEIRVAFDGATNSLMIYVDDQLAGATEVEGAMRGDYPRPLEFGNPWGDAEDNFDGTLTAFDLEVGNQDFPEYAGEPAVIISVSEPLSTVSAEDTGANDPVQDNSPTTGSPLEEPMATPEATEDPDAVDSADEPVDEVPTESSAPTTVPEDANTEVPVDDTSLQPQEPLYTAKFSDVGLSESGIALLYDAHVVQNPDGNSAVVLDGKGDFVSLGRIEALEDSQQLNLSLDFQRSDLNGGTERMVWNHMKFGISVKDDVLSIHVASPGEHFHKGFEIANAAIDDTELHSLNVAVDAEADRLQVVLDGNVVLDEWGTNLDFVGAGGYEWGWTIGSAWQRDYEGSVSAFELDDVAVFIDDAAALL